jgi:hypothetical protein
MMSELGKKRGIWPKFVYVNIWNPQRVLDASMEFNKLVKVSCALYKRVCLFIPFQITSSQLNLAATAEMLRTPDNPPGVLFHMHAASSQHLTIALSS